MTTTVTPSLDLNLVVLDFLREVCPSDRQPNPYTKVKLLSCKSGIAFQIEAPIPGKGLARTTSSPESGREIYSLLLRMMSRALGNFTLQAALIQELSTAGVLLPLHTTPVRPLFACTLTDCELERLGAAGCIGGPPREVSRKASLLPTCAQLSGHDLTWIYDPVRQLDWPYWLTAAQTEQLRQIVPASGNAGSEHWNRVLGEASSSVWRTGCAIVRDILPPEFLRGIQRYYRELTANGFLTLGDGQSLRYTVHNEPLARWLHQHTVPLISRIIPESVKPSYTYLGFYLAGAILERHTDRKQCEYTLSLTIDATPSATAAQSWPLFAELKDGTTVEARLGVGDGLLFKGRELPHYRHRLDEERTSSSVFLHYVPEAFVGKLE